MSHIGIPLRPRCALSGTYLGKQRVEYEVKSISNQIESSRKRQTDPAIREIYVA
jgi:hypothetical protein